MTAEEPSPRIPPVLPAEHALPVARPSWSDRYGERHRLYRITEFPAGIVAPRKVRVYWRHDHYLLQWWSPAQGKNVSEHITGDLLTALVRARVVDERLANFPRAAAATVRCGH